MKDEEICQIVVRMGPFVVLTVVLYCIYLWKTTRARKLLTKATSSFGDTNARDAVSLLKQALWKANEKPELERSILAKLGQTFQQGTIAFNEGDYLILIGEFEQLSQKGSYKALQEIRKVQTLKKQLIDRMPNLP